MINKREVKNAFKRSYHTCNGYDMKIRSFELIDHGVTPFVSDSNDPIEKIVDSIKFVKEWLIKPLDKSHEKYNNGHRFIVKQKFTIKFHCDFDGVFPHNKIYEYVFEKGYTWDGASIPKLVQFVGSPTDEEFIFPSMVHDKGTENDPFNNNRYVHDAIFQFLLDCEKQPVWRDDVLSFFVRMYSNFKIKLNGWFK